MLNMDKTDKSNTIDKMNKTYVFKKIDPFKMILSIYVVNAWNDIVSIKDELDKKMGN